MARFALDRDCHFVPESELVYTHLPQVDPANRTLAHYRKLRLPPSPLLNCSWRSASINSNTRNSSSVMSDSVIVSPMLFALRIEAYQRRVIVKILVGGFEFEGQVYRSLSAVAREVTGTKWNGFLFFNLASIEEASNGKK